jgi:hypothetical protein
MRLSDLANDTRKLAVVYKTSANEFIVNLEYRTQVVTLGFLSELVEQIGIERVVYQIVKILAKWDLTDDDDKVIPITEESIKAHDIPIYLLNSILEAITQDRIALSEESKNG